MKRERKVDAIVMMFLYVLVFGYLVENRATDNPDSLIPLICLKMEGECLKNTEKGCKLLERINSDHSLYFLFKHII